MANRVTTGLYEFDPQGLNPDNLITNELHTLVAPHLDEYYYTIPYAAPFFVNTLKIFHNSNNVQLVEGVDYIVGHRFIEAMTATGTTVAGSVRFLNRSLNGVFRFEYHTIGGIWGFNDTVILEELNNRFLNPLIRSWGQIAPLPVAFPAVPHDQRVDDLVGSEELLNGIQGIMLAIDSAGSGISGEHLTNYDNPHQTTKAQVGLQFVQNYPIASEAQATGGTNNVTYLTPLRGYQLVYAQAILPLIEHIENTDNPHGTNANHVGLGLVQNLPLADATTAQDPSRNDVYLTPWSASILFANTGEGARITALEEAFMLHLNDLDNPHELTIDELDGYSRGEIDQMISNVQQGDTNSFAGMDEDAWRASLPSFSLITDILNTLIEEYGVGIGHISSVDETLEPLTGIYAPARFIACESSYVIVNEGFNSLNQFFSYVDVVPSDSPFAGSTNTDADSYSQLGNAYYWIDSDGYIHNSGADSYQPGANYRPSASNPPDPAPEQIVATTNGVFVRLYGDVLFKFTSTVPNTTVSSGVYEFSVAPYGVERGLGRREDGTVLAFGDGSWTSVMSPIVNSLVDVAKVLVTDTECYVLFENGTVQGWSTIGTVGAPISLPTEYHVDIYDIVGYSNHCVFLRNNGDVLTRGNNDYGQCEIPAGLGTIKQVAAGHGYTVLIDGDGYVHYLGKGDDLSVLPPEDYSEVS